MILPDSTDVICFLGVKNCKNQAELEALVHLCTSQLGFVKDEILTILQDDIEFYGELEKIVQSLSEILQQKRVLFVYLDIFQEEDISRPVGFTSAEERMIQLKKDYPKLRILSSGGFIQQVHALSQ